MVQKYELSSSNKMLFINRAFVTILFYGMLFTLGQKTLQAQEGDATAVDIPTALAPIPFDQTLVKLNNLLGGKIIKQTFVAGTGDGLHIAVEEFCCDPRNARAKFTRKVIIGNLKELTYEPSALDVDVDSGVLVDQQYVYKIYKPTHKWALQFDVGNLNIVGEQINKCFLETQGPFPALIKSYFHRYLADQKLNLPDEATGALESLKKIKNPGVDYSFQTQDGKYRQEFAFYDNGLLRKANYFSDGKLTGCLLNETISSAEFNIPDANMQGALRTNSPLYLQSMRKYEHLSIARKMSLGILLEFTDHGPTVKDVYKGSPAAKAGLKPGDIIVGVGSMNVIALPPKDVTKMLNDASKVVLQIKEIDGNLRELALDKVDENTFKNERGFAQSAFPR